jgi:hypothetical protein
MTLSAKADERGAECAKVPMGLSDIFRAADTLSQSCKTLFPFASDDCLSSSGECTQDPGGPKGAENVQRRLCLCSLRRWKIIRRVRWFAAPHKSGG